MKRLLTILAFLLLAVPAYADESMQLARMSGPMLGSGGGVAAACSGSFTYATGLDYDLGVRYNFISNSFTTIEAITNSNKLCVKLRQIGTAPDVQITYYLYDDSSGVPSTLLSTSTTTLSAQSVNGALQTTEDYTDYCLTMTPEVSLASATRYHVVLGGAAYTDTTNKVVWAMNDGGSPTQNSFKGETAPPSTDYGTTQNCYITVGCN